MKRIPNYLCFICMTVALSATALATAEALAAAIHLWLPSNLLRRFLLVTLVRLLLDENRHGVGRRLFISKCFRLGLSGRADSSPSRGHGIARLRYLPEFAGLAFDKFEVAGFGTIADRNRNRCRRIRLCGHRRLRFFQGNSNVVPHTNPTRKSRHACVRKLLETKGYGSADAGRILAFAVAETRADGETGAVRQANQQRPHPALVTASAGLMSNDNGFSIVKRFDLQQRR